MTHIIESGGDDLQYFMNQQINTKEKENIESQIRFYLFAYVQVS